jgi:amino acid transporter
MNIAQMNVLNMVRVISFLPFVIGFAVTIIFFFVIFGQFDIEINGDLTVGIILIALIVGGFIHLWKMGSLHQGHFSTVIGVIFIIVAVVLLYGVASFAYTDENGEIQMKEKLWDLTPQESGVFVLIGVLGVFSLVTGIKLALQNQYFWGRR